ncbi:MAG: HAD hydrolase-like protein [Nitrolancea sp.]
MRRLILFDVDGTLIARGDPVHIAAIDASVTSSFPSLGVSIRDIEFDGKVDRQILRDLVRAGGVSDDLDPSLLLTMIEAATRSYREAWTGRLGDADLLPGVRGLIQRLAALDEFALGLLTGGIRGIVDAKMTRLGLERFFPIGAFGDEVERRVELLHLALERAHVRYHVQFAPEDVVVVGDTPRDVEASHSGNVACVGVATGRFTEAELSSAGADAVLSDLTATDDVVELLRTVRRSPVTG